MMKKAGEKKKKLSLQSGSKTQKDGSKGERRACLYLKLHGYRILDRNWLFGHKEIDIIAKKGDVVAFIEVKSGRTIGEISPMFSVTSAKRRNIVAAAKAYIPYRGMHNVCIRFDIIEVDLSRKLPFGCVKHIISAFH